MSTILLLIVDKELFGPVFLSNLTCFLILIFLLCFQIFVSIVSGILISYTKLTISTIMRDHGKRALFWCGICIQIGSCIGALVMFPLVNIAKLFHQ